MSMVVYFVVSFVKVFVDNLVDAFYSKFLLDPDSVRVTSSQRNTQPSDVDIRPSGGRKK